jgi:aspartate kinase
MGVIVKKFGGTSLGTIERIDHLAAKIAGERKADDQIVIVVSAMAKTTDYLFSLAYRISDSPYQRELDMLVTAGERISMSLLSMALHKYGVQAISFTGSQSGIITDNCHGNAQIVNVNAFRIKEELNKGKIVIVAGYQGVSPQKEVTTLGRGGSDTTAVALAGYLKADKCQIYTDVDGVYDVDPKYVADARKIHVIDYSTMLILAESGCKVIHSRAVEFAMKYEIDVEIKSSFTENLGTKLIKEVTMEERELKAITGNKTLTVYQIDVSDKSLEGLMALMQSNDCDLLDYTLISEKTMQVVLNNADTTRFERKLKNLSFFEYKRIDDLSSLTFVGQRIKNDLNFLMEVLTAIREFKTEIFQVNRNSMGFTIYLVQHDYDNHIKILHEKFVLEK